MRLLFVARALHDLAGGVERMIISVISAELRPELCRYQLGPRRRRRLLRHRSEGFLVQAGLWRSETAGQPFRAAAARVEGSRHGEGL